MPEEWIGWVLTVLADARVSGASAQSVQEPRMMHRHKMAMRRMG